MPTPVAGHRLVRSRSAVPEWTGEYVGNHSSRSVEAECSRRGRGAIVSGCVDPLAGREVDDALMLALGGRPARACLDDEDRGRWDYWPRVWGVTLTPHHQADEVE
jgi:hypothetical protein